MKYIVVILILVFAGCSTPEDREWRHATEKLCRYLGGEPSWNGFTDRAGCDMSYFVEKE